MGRGIPKGWSRRPVVKMSYLILIPLLALVCTGLLAGIFLGHRAGVSQAGPRLAPATFIQLQQLIHGVYARMMPPLVLVAVISSIVWAILLRSEARFSALWLVSLASVALVLAAVLTRAVNIPINAQLMTWRIDSPPANFRELWKPWERVHSIRTGLAIIAFVLQALALCTIPGPG